jgi:hypothetical protein
MARTLEEAEKLISLYEQNGAAKLYYALQRKMNEMGDMLNKQSLSTLDLTDAKDKSFERIKVIWDSAEKVATAVKSLGDSAGITGDEEKDLRMSRKATTPESMAQEIGDYKTQNV